MVEEGRFPYQKRNSLSPNPDLKKGTPFQVRHCEHLKGACLHAEVPVFAETHRAGRRYGTQAWQSHRKNRHCFVSLAMTISKSGFGLRIEVAFIRHLL
jgi:hypothetical protein